MTIPPLDAAVLENALESFNRASAAAQQAARPDAVGQPELSQAMVDVILAQRAFEAAVRFVQIQEQVSSEVLEIAE